VESLVLGGGELAGPEPAPYMSYNIFQLEIILLKVIRLFSLGRRHDCRLPLAGSCCQHPLGAGFRTEDTGPPKNSPHGSEQAKAKKMQAKMFANNFRLAPPTKVREIYIFFC